MEGTGSGRLLHPGHVDTMAFTCVVRERRETSGGVKGQTEVNAQGHIRTPCMSYMSPDGQRAEVHRGEQWGWTGGGREKEEMDTKMENCNFSKTNVQKEECVPCSTTALLTTPRCGHHMFTSQLTSRTYRGNLDHSKHSPMTLTPCKVTQRSSISLHRRRWGLPEMVLSLLLVLMTVGGFSGVRMVSAQTDTCPDDTSCYPLSENLLSPVYPVRTLDVSSTCGTPDGTNTIYRKSSATLDFDDFVCNATDPHPKENMYDHQNEKVLDFEYENPKLSTYWQSMNTIDVLGEYPRTEWVVFNLTEAFLIRYIRIVFISPHILSATDDSDNRPLAMVIERQATPGAGWTPWRYYAKDCLLRFPGIAWQTLDGTGPDFSATTPVCQQRYYAGSTPVTGWGFGRQEVQFNPSRDFDPEFQTSAEVGRHFMASAIRIRLVIPADSEPLSSYYAIGDLEVDGQCSCFGHAAFCSGVNGATCGCTHNTEGENCERCLPLYNNKPWRPGALQKANACEDCGCGGHATSCRYDIDKGYGVCDNCTDNTMGDKCDFCVDYFYINPVNTSLIPISDTCSGFNGTEYITYKCNAYCIPCNCSVEGTDQADGYTCQNATGQCLCKTHVEGRDCSICKDEFYNLTASNPDGCQACDCEVSGTFNSTQLCDKDSGTCICKNNTHGHRCDECKPGYYGLSADDPDGCRPCGCNPGASLNMSCPLVTGVCHCRERIGGRTCQQPDTGFYVPALDHLTYDAEFAPNISAKFTLVERPGHGELLGKVTGRGFVQLMEASTLRLTVQLPATTLYHVIARYETAGLWAPAHLSMKAVDPGNVSEYACGGATVSATSLHQLDATIQPAAPAGGVDFGQLCLLGGVEYDLHFELGNSDPVGEKFLLDSMVLLPALEELSFFGEVTADTREELQKCLQETVSVNLEQRANYSCAAQEYSVMSYLYDGAIACECDPVGSNSSLCDPMGGQCPCKPGVMLLDCSQCLVDYYGFSTGQGCTPCGCDPHGSVRTACNDTGVCECRPNVHGDQCESCLDEHYGLYTGTGCIPCTCNMDYAYNNSCSDSGQCPCKPGVGGKNCDFCLDGYFSLTSEGCTPCECDIDGSTSSTCDKTTGVCTCKTLAVGDKCDQCQPGYYALGDWSPLGCLQCYCSGHSSECNSAPGWFLTNASNDWSLLMSATAIQEPWLGVDGDGNSIQVDHPVKIIGNQGQFVMQVTNIDNILPLTDVFFLASPRYLGNKRSAYKHNLSFSLSMYVPDPDTNDTITDPIMDPHVGGDVILEGNGVDFKLVVALSEHPGINVTEYSFQLTPEVWHVDTVGGANPSYVQMIQVLSDISAIRIRAKYSNVSAGEVALYSALMTYAVNDSSSGIPVNNVENCTCPRQYTGQQCEKCAPGYTRLTPNGGAYTECVPCNCHGHGTSGMPCDPETGMCVCDHNTKGNLCELCEDGYYGDATRGAPDACKPCMCPGNVIEGDVNVFAVTCSLGPQGTPICINCTEGHGGDQCDVCVDQWYGVPTNPLEFGGRCLPCECNGRADTCNTTMGECINCVNNTAGQKCDICAPTFYGNALTGDCISCECTGPGAEGDCDHRTGQCVCKPNVVGFTCTECGPHSFNFSSGLGCQDCDCHPIGAFDQECDVITGQCVCHVHLEGRQCDRCEDTYWNINSRTGCDPCECTDLGTANVTGETFGMCDLQTGQCTCARPAIIGRTCDYCAKGTKEEFEYVTGIYVGTYPNCELCGECFDNWGAKIDEVGVEMLNQYTEALHIWDHYGNMTVEEVYPIIGNLSANITLVDDTMNTTLHTVHDVRLLQDGYDEISNNVTIHSMELSRLEEALTDAQTMLDNLKAFSGTITLPSSTTTTIATTRSVVLEETATQFLIYSHANSSWAVIQNLTEAVRVSNGSVAVFVDRVAAAMLELEDAGRMANAAEMILGGQFHQENENNTARLKVLEGYIALYPSVISQADSEVDAARLKLTEGNMTMDLAVAAVASRLDEMKGYLNTATLTGYNASIAHEGATQAASVVAILQFEANATRGNLTVALVTVVDGLHLTENITAEIALLDAAATEIFATFLRPLADMTAITSQIEGTSLSQAEVQKLLSSADATLNMAAAAINVTETASQEAYKTLGMVQVIQYNLEEASLLRNKTEDMVSTVSKYNDSITSTLNKVQAKAALASSLADEVHANITIAAVDINDIYKCFRDKQARANTTRIEAQQAETEAMGAAIMQEQNIQQLRAVTVRTVGLDGQFTSTLHDLLDIKDEVDALLEDLGIVSGGSDTNFLLETFQTQRNEVDEIAREVLNIDGDANLAQDNLDRLDPETATCTHS